MRHCLTPIQMLLVLRNSIDGSQPIHNPREPFEAKAPCSRTRQIDRRSLWNFMKRHLPALFFLLLVSAGFGTWFFSKPDPHGSAMHVRAIATRGLAEQLAQAYSGKQALIISNPFTQQTRTARHIMEAEEAGVRGLRDGFGGKVSIAAVVFPELKPEAWENPRALLGETDTSTPLSYLVTNDAFDQLARQHNCELIVSLIGLPLELNRCESWNAPAGPKFALLLPDLRIIGDTAAVEAALRSGKLAAFVLRKPGAPGDDSPPGKDFRTEFERRFVLVTPGNFEEVRRDHPALF